MKLIKFSIAALVLTISAQFAKAQVSVGVGVQIGRPYRTVVVRDPYPVYETYPRTVYYERPVYRHYPRTVIYRSGYRGYRRGYYGYPQYRRANFGPAYGRGFGHGRGNGHWRR